MKYWPGGLILAGVEDLHDVGVDQACRRLRLALEARHERGVLGEVLGQQLHRHRALQAQVEGEVNGGHPAEAQPALQAVAPSDLHAAHLPPSWLAPPGPPPRGAPSPAPPRPCSEPSPGEASPPPAPGAGVPPPGPEVVGVVVGVVGWWSSGWRWGSWGWSRAGGGLWQCLGRGCLRERLPAKREGVRVQLCDAFVEPVAQACIDSRGKRAEVPFGLEDRGFGGDAAPAGIFGSLSDGFEVALQGPGVVHRDQPRTGAPAGKEQCDRDAQRGAGSAHESGPPRGGSRSVGSG